MLPLPLSAQLDRGRLTVTAIVQLEKTTAVVVAFDAPKVAVADINCYSSPPRTLDEQAMVARHV